MTSLYNCKHDGDQFRITKFDSDFNVEASYLCDLVACECPAGHRPRCRHREMLPKFIQRGHIGDNWFYDHDRGGWVQGAGFEPTAQPISDQPEQSIPFQLGGFPYDCYDNLCTTPTDCIINGCTKGNGKPSRRLAPEGLCQTSEQEPSNQFTNPLAVSGAESSVVVATMVGNEDEGSSPSALPLTASGPSPSPTIRRRV